MYQKAVHCLQMRIWIQTDVDSLSGLLIFGGFIHLMRNITELKTTGKKRRERKEKNIRGPSSEESESYYCLQGLYPQGDTAFKSEHEVIQQFTCNFISNYPPKTCSRGRCAFALMLWISPCVEIFPLGMPHNSHGKHWRQPWEWCFVWTKMGPHI